jgi:TonB family protein
MLGAKLAVFSLAFFTGVSSFWVFGYFASPNEEERPRYEASALEKERPLASGTGSASCGIRRDPLTEHLPGDNSIILKDRSIHNKEDVSARQSKAFLITSPLRLTNKKSVDYTESARANGIEGTVTLRVTFLASGGIGSITTLKGLPYGLTEQAINAAKALEFEPEKVNGIPRTTSRPVSFTFSLY